MTQRKTGLVLDGKTRDEGSLGRYDLIDPATGEATGSMPKAGRAEALEAAALAGQGFREWSAIAPYDRSRILRRAADLMRGQTEEAARDITREMGKPLDQARAEWGGCSDLLEWFAEEGRRAYGRLIPARSSAMSWTVRRRPVGAVAAFTPWNFPAWTAMQKIAPALAAGCSVVLKPAEETPGAPYRIVQALLDAGLPPRAIGMIAGDPAEISSTLTAAPEIGKITLTGSTRVGRLLASQAGQHLKKATMELGGHNPVIVARDADLDTAIALTAEWKFRNAGQVCVSPTRFLVEAPLYADFVSGLAEAVSRIKVGNGFDPDTRMGPMATRGQIDKIDGLVEDARRDGAKVETGGERIGNHGFFYQPTVLSGLTPEMRAMNEEPFGPLALVMPVPDLDAALTEANRLPYGLASYAFTRSRDTEQKIANTIEAGMLAINHFGLAMPETPFGGIHDSGLGSEGGIEGMDAYLTPFLVSGNHG